MGESRTTHEPTDDLLTYWTFTVVERVDLWETASDLCRTLTIREPTGNESIEIALSDVSSKMRRKLDAQSWSTGDCQRKECALMLWRFARGVRSAFLISGDCPLSWVAG